MSSDSESLSGAAILPKLELLNETSLYLQTARGKSVIVGHYAPAHIVTVCTFYMLCFLIEFH